VTGGGPAFFDLIRSRRSVRRYRPTEVGEEDLAAVLDAMLHAPSAGDLQAYAVVAVKDREIRERLAQAAHGQEYVAQAPVVLVFFADPHRSYAKYGPRGELYACQDATIAAAHAQLAAHARGLGTVWVGAFEDRAVSRAVGAPSGLQPSCLLVVGWPAETPEATPRRPLADLLRRERFG
jgi:nitroreductase